MPITLMDDVKGIVYCLNHPQSNVQYLYHSNWKTNWLTFLFIIFSCAPMNHLHHATIPRPSAAVQSSQTKDRLII